MDKTTSKRIPKTSFERYRREMGFHQAILGVLKAQGPMTIKEIAKAVGINSQDAMMYVMAMLRYGILKEAPKERRDRYWKYGVVNP